jgi:hypothetical protein
MERFVIFVLELFSVVAAMSLFCIVKDKECNDNDL